MCAQVLKNCLILQTFHNAVYLHFFIPFTMTGIVSTARFIPDGGSGAKIRNMSHIIFAESVFKLSHFRLQRRYCR